jgi:hypothetical protein
VSRLALWGAVAALVAATAAGAAPRDASPELPRPSLSLPESLEALAAAGPRVALATAGLGCTIRVIALGAANPKPVEVRGVGDGLTCDEEVVGNDSLVYGLWLGRSTIDVLLYESPSPHGDSYSVWTGRLPAGPVRQIDFWGWSDSEDPPGYGCSRDVAAGGGVIASAPAPNFAAVDAKVAKEPTCAGTQTTKISLSGSPPRTVSVPGSWSLLGTDGTRIVLSGLDEHGRPDGTLSVVGLDGRPGAAPRFDTATAKAAERAWLTPDGLVLLTRGGLRGPGWKTGPVGTAAVAYGRVLYIRGYGGGEVRVRRIRDGRDRHLLYLPQPSTNAELAAGSFGVAVAVETRHDHTSLYRVRWGTIDRVLPG